MALDRSDWTPHRYWLEKNYDRYLRRRDLGRVYRLDRSRMISVEWQIQAWDENRHHESKLHGFERYWAGDGSTNADCACGKNWVLQYGETWKCPEERPI